MSEGIISVVLFFSMREVKSNTTTLTKSSHHAQYFFLFFFYFSSFTENARNVFPHNRAAIDWKEWETKIVFLWFSNNHSCLCWCFSFFSQRSTRSSLMLFFSSLAAWYYYFQLFFFFLSTFNYFSLVFFSNSLAHSLSLTHLFNVLCAMSVEIFFIFTANNILLWYDNVKLYYNNSYRRL